MVFFSLRLFRFHRGYGLTFSFYSKKWLILRKYELEKKRLYVFKTLKGIRWTFFVFIPKKLDLQGIQKLIFLKCLKIQNPQKTRECIMKPSEMASLSNSRWQTEKNVCEWMMDWVCDIYLMLLISIYYSTD